MPFDHTKLVVVDREWVLFGSSNWDPRSLRLNFELDVECHDPRLAAEMDDLAVAKMVSGRRVTLEEVDSRPLLLKLGHAFARLLSPYL
jgi:cardiolipin synthase